MYRNTVQSESAINQNAIKNARRKNPDDDNKFITLCLQENNLPEIKFKYSLLGEQN